MTEKIMTVNGTDISEYSARFWRIEPGKRMISNESMSLGGLGTAVMLPPEFGLREYKLDINVHGETRMLIWKNVSSIIKEFEKIADVHIEGADGQKYFKLSLTGVEQTEYGQLKDRWDILTLTCLGYEYGSKEFIRISDDVFVFEEAPKEGFGACVASVEREIEIKGSAVVPVNVQIEQTARAIIENSEYCDNSLVGKKYPIYADIKIYGLCRGKRGKDLGAMEVRLRPETDPLFIVGAGVTGYHINGMTGKGKVYKYNHYTYPEHLQSHSLPAPALAGFPGQKVKIEILAHRADVITNCCEVVIFYNPVYL